MLEAQRIHSVALDVNPKIGWIPLVRAREVDITGSHAWIQNRADQGIMAEQILRVDEVFIAIEK
ncbi:hypothetical protein N7486_003425 [Penicillium sp. IBT 16267x]|nr:hypothetical protein N7486_003425 [Penicillium sp. IBT 16267x]